MNNIKTLNADLSNLIAQAINLKSTMVHVESKKSSPCIIKHSIRGALQLSDSSVSMTSIYEAFNFQDNFYGDGELRTSVDNVDVILRANKAPIFGGDAVYIKVLQQS
ncbi:MAG: hypothetical protein Q7K26_06715 [bacterium]|nr:hypothetical protein [bacterium]